MKFINFLKDGNEGIHFRDIVNNLDEDDFELSAIEYHKYLNETKVGSKVFKYKDSIDGHFAFVLAKSEDEANEKLKSTTSINFQLIEWKWVDYIDPIIIRSQILPF